MIALPILMLFLIFGHAGHPAQPASAGAPTATAAATAPGAQPTTTPTVVPSTTPGAGATPPSGASASPGAGSPVPAPPSAQPSAPSAQPAPASAQPAPLASESASPYKYRFVPHQPGSVQAGQPVIVAVYLNSQHLRSEGPILIKVQTNEAVVQVISRSNGRGGGIPRLSSGDFEAASKMPKLPVIAHGMTVDIEFIATSADGRKTSVRVPVKLD